MIEEFKAYLVKNSRKKCLGLRRADKLVRPHFFFNFKPYIENWYMSIYET